jgi:hypothetical protein
MINKCPSLSVMGKNGMNSIALHTDMYLYFFGGGGECVYMIYLDLLLNIINIVCRRRH